MNTKFQFEEVRPEIIGEIIQGRVQLFPSFISEKTEDKTIQDKTTAKELASKVLYGGIKQFGKKTYQRLQESGAQTQKDYEIMNNPLASKKEKMEAVKRQSQMTIGMTEPLKKVGGVLTTKFLEYAKGKTTLSRQEILDFARRPELKKGEADLLLRKLEEFEPKGVRETGKLPAQEFTDSIRRDLLELKPVKVKEPQYQGATIEGYARTEQFKKSKNYEEVVFESPIKTDGSTHYPNSKNYFAHARGDEVVEGGKKIWREQEIQSDFVRSDRLENAQGVFKGADTPEKALEILNKNPKSEVLRDAYNRQLGILKLQPFTNDRFGERIMRERIKAKAQAGYEKYRLPTGETIGKIEGFQPSAWNYVSYSERPTTRGQLLWGKAVKLEELKVGLEVTQDGSTAWIITDILGDGRFKAVPKEGIERLSKSFKQTIEQTLKDPEALIRLQESFDLTGKSNPQYRRYSDWGKFLKNKYGGKEVVDPQGNSWMEINLKKEQGRMPIEAFGFGQIGKILTGAGIGAGISLTAPYFMGKHEEKLEENLRHDLELSIQNKDTETFLKILDYAQKRNLIPEEEINQIRGEVLRYWDIDKEE